MAQRRIFSIRVTNLPRFLRLPPTARLAFFDLSMAADDDGFVEAYTVMRITGATEDDLKALQGIGYLRILNPDLLCWLCVWGESNKVPSDRYHPSIYHAALDDLKAGRLVETNFLDAYSLDTVCKQTGNELIPEVSPVQLSQGESSLCESRSMSESMPDNDDDDSYDSFFQKKSPAKLKELMSAWCGFGKVTLTQLRDLLFGNGVDPEVVLWAAQKAADSSADSPSGYFWTVINDKALSPDGQCCKTLSQLIRLEGQDKREMQRIELISREVQKMREQLHAEWATETEQPF